MKAKVERVFRNAAKRTYTNPRGNDVKFSNSTIERWYYDYKRRL